MKRITHLVFVAAFACGAQAVSAEQSDESADLRTASASAESQGEAIGSTRARDRSHVAQPVGAMENYLTEMGFSALAPFPSRGAEIDD